MGRLLRAMGAAALVFGLSTTAHADNDCATKAGYERLSTGMTYRQAVAALGCEGEELSSSEMAGFKTVMYAWVGSGVSGLMGGNMNAMFQNDRMVNKAQLGLK